MAARIGLAGVMLAAAAVPAGAVQINVTYTDGASEGFNDPQLGTARRTAFEAAAGEWASRLAGTVPVTISASMDPLEISGGGAVLGSAGPAGANRDFTGAPAPRVFYPSALANQLAGQDMDTSSAEIIARFNSDIDDSTKWPASASWYYGLDGNSGTKTDFYSVVEHEFGHGLGFLSFIQQDGSFLNGFPITFDQFKVNGSAPGSRKATSLSQTERAALEVSDSLYFDGPLTVTANGGTNAKLYAPPTWEQGSSGSHLDQQRYANTPHRLMCPVYTTPVHDPGSIIIAIMKDIGWADTATPTPTPTPTGGPTPTPTGTPSSDLQINITTPANGVTYGVLPKATGTASGADLVKVYVALAKANASGKATGWYHWDTGVFGTDPEDTSARLATGTKNWSIALPALANGKYRLVAEADGSDGSSYDQAVSVFTIGPIPGQTVSGKCLSIIMDDDFATPVRRGLAGVTVTLSKNGNTVATTTSAADGSYSFTKVGNGTFTITTSTTRPTQPVTTLDPPSRTFLVNGAPVAVDRFALYSIFGTVKGPNASGTVIPQSNVTVTLINQNNVAVATRTTDIDGHYEFRQQRGATFRLAVTKKGFTFTGVNRSVPSTGSDFSPCTRANFTGLRNPTTGSVHTF